MTLKSRFGVENVGKVVTFTFYAIVGIICFVALPMTDFPPHIGIIGILSLVTAYGLFRSRAWALWVVVALLFIATTFSAYTLYFVFQKDLLLDVSMISYLLLTWFFTAYTAKERKALES